MSWFGNKLPSHLPRATGPYVPGCADVMLEYETSGIFFRLHYPTNVDKNEKELPAKWMQWIPDYAYIAGLAKVLVTLQFVIRTVLWWTAGNKKIPALYGAKPKTDQPLKCIIFSHGFGSCRFLHSAICTEMASRGFLILTMEHRDGSACHTYYYKSKEDATIDVKTPIDHVTIEFGKENYPKRNAQVNHRAEECSKAIDFLINLNKGQISHNVLDDYAPNREIDFKLEDLVGKIDTDSFTMSGHSFGGATALLTLSKRKEIKQGILLDPWMFPIKDEPNLIQNVTQPLLFVNTQTFHIASNVKGMEKFLTSDDRKMYTMLHSTHENQIDAVYAVGYWLNWFMKKLDPKILNRINNYLMIRFLNNTIQYPENIEDCEKYLDEQSINIVPGLTKPWV